MRAKRLKQNITLMYAIHLASSLIFFYPILALYFKEQLFTAFNVSLVLATQSVAVAIFEIPTGVFADRIGRKTSIIIALLFDHISIALLTTAEILPEFFLYSICIAFSAALSSGTFDAFIFDTLQELNQQQLYKKVKGKIGSMQTLAAAIASFFGGILASISLKNPMYISMVPMFIALLCGFFLIEPHYHKPIEQITVFNHMKNASRSIFANKQLLIMAIILILGVNIMGPIFDLRQLFYEAIEIPVEFFGILAAAGLILYSIGSHSSHIISDMIGNKHTMLICKISIISIVVIATTQSSFVSAIIFVIAFLAMGLYNPVEDHMINIEIASHNRATVLSTINFSKSLLLAVSIPLMGLAMDLFGINSAFRYFSVVALLLVLLLLFIEEKN